MILTPDTQTLLLLCTRLALPVDFAVEPLTLREWNGLAQKLREASFQPADLAAIADTQLASSLGISEQEATRLARLLGRAEILPGALDRLAGLGIQALTRFSPNYPERYHERLKDSAPLVLFCAGEIALLGQPGIAVVGSRHLDPVGQECAAFVGNACGLSGLVLYSGGARGVDAISMDAALEARGTAAGILADNLEKAVRPQPVRQALERGDLCLATPYSPNAGFSVGGAMGRNKLIYCLADYAVVVASDAEKGGTWAGSTEAIKAGWLPVFVLQHPAMPEGNQLLIRRGGVPFPHPFPEHYSQLPNWLKEHSPIKKQKSEQLGLL